MRFGEKHIIGIVIGIVAYEIYRRRG